MKRILHALVLLATVFGFTTGSTPAGSQQPQAIIPDEIRGLKSPRWGQEPPSAVKRALQSPLYMKLSLSPYLLEALCDDQQFEISDQVPDLPGGHDPAVVAGRAAWMIQELYEIEIPAISDTTTAAQLRNYRDVAETEMRAYRGGVLSTVEEYRIGFDVKKLQRRYQGQLGTGPEGWLTYDDLGPFQGLLLEFFPIGKRLSDLEMIVGQRSFYINPETKVLEFRPETVDPTGVFEYRFDTGFGGRIYYFFVEDDVITGVIAMGLE